MKSKRLLKPALVYAVDLLARQDYSENRLREKLTAKGYEDEEIEAAVLRLQEKHYLNDEESCGRRFRYLYTESSYSVRQICVKLMERGYASRLVKSCIPEDREEVSQREYTAALRVLESKYRRSQDKQKLLAAMFRRGFSGSIVYQAVNDFLTDEEE